MTNEEAFTDLKGKRPTMFRTVRTAVFMLWTANQIGSHIELLHGDPTLAKQCRQAARYMYAAEVEAETAKRATVSASKDVMVQA